jgi:hypothetical protein
MIFFIILNVKEKIFLTICGFRGASLTSEVAGKLLRGVILFNGQTGRGGKKAA